MGWNYTGRLEPARRLVPPDAGEREVLADVRCDECWRAKCEPWHRLNEATCCVECERERANVAEAMGVIYEEMSHA